MKASIHRVFNVVVIHHEKEIAACLGSPVQAAVYADRVAHIVVLNKIDPR